MKNTTTTILLGTLLLAPSIYASKLFVSNNTGVISSDQAYERLHNETQKDLSRKTLASLQDDHFEVGTFESSLGAYYMQSSNQITADNTLVFTFSPRDHNGSKSIAKKAAELAKEFDQESVAVFIDDGRSSNMDIKVNFDSTEQPTYADLQQYMPALEENNLVAFSIYLADANENLDSAHVAAIEWLTTPDRLPVIEDTFPGTTIVSESGQAELVYQDRHVEQIS